FMPSVCPGPIPKVARCFAFYFADGPSSKHERVDINISHAAERKLAKQYGLEGFCYYTNGLANERRTNLLNSIIAVEDQFGFCLCWTGAHQLEERASASVFGSHDEKKRLAVDFLEQVVPLLQHSNYLRIDGRAVLIVYQAAS